MKRAFAFTLALVLFISGCAQEAATGPVSEYEKLWAVDIGQEGFKRTTASLSFVRDNGEVELKYTVMPDAFHDDDRRCTKTVKANGRTYKTGSGFVFWDGPSGGGTDYIQNVQWKHGGYSFLLSASTAQYGLSLDIASPKTAFLLERDPQAEVPGYSLNTNYLWTSLYTSGASICITLYPTAFSESAMNLPEEAFSGFTDEGGFQYCRYERKSLTDDPIFVSLLWNTDIGVFYIYSNWTVHNSEPGDALGFVNAELMKSITEQMDSKILPLDEFMK